MSDVLLRSYSWRDFFAFSVGNAPYNWVTRPTLRMLLRFEITLMIPRHYLSSIVIIIFLMTCSISIAIRLFLVDYVINFRSYRCYDSLLISNLYIFVATVCSFYVSPQIFAKRTNAHKRGIRSESYSSLTL